MYSPCCMYSSTAVNYCSSSPRCFYVHCCCFVSCQQSSELWVLSLTSCFQPGKLSCYCTEILYTFFGYMHVSYPDTLHVWPPFSPAGLYGAPAVLLHISVAALFSVVDVFFLQDGRCREAISVLVVKSFSGVILCTARMVYSCVLTTGNAGPEPRAEP